MSKAQVFKKNDKVRVVHNDATYHFAPVGAVGVFKGISELTRTGTVEFPPGTVPTHKKGEPVPEPWTQHIPLADLKPNDQPEDTESEAWDA